MTAGSRTPGVSGSVFKRRAHCQEFGDPSRGDEAHHAVPLDHDRDGLH
jgi:hypothetical protein